jgi:hypothetical protein
MQSPIRVAAQASSPSHYVETDTVQHLYELDNCPIPHGNSPPSAPLNIIYLDTRLVQYC